MRFQWYSVVEMGGVVIEFTRYKFPLDTYNVHIPSGSDKLRVYLAPLKKQSKWYHMI